MKTKGLEWLSGGGEMAELIRGLDWSKTPLGAIETWPPSLRTTVSLCLASNFPINIIWGPQGIQIYNAGYRVICGQAHPRAIGEPYEVTWASAWPVIGEPYTNARRGETSYLENQRMFLDRNGYLEETFFTFTLSPIRDESGGVAGLFHPVTETTTTMLAERRSRVLRDIANKASSAKTVLQASSLIIKTLSEYSTDLPFVMLFLLEASESKETAVRLMDHTGISSEKMMFNSKLGETLGIETFSKWPLQEALKTSQINIIKNFETNFFFIVCNEYPDPIKNVAILPLKAAGKDSHLGFIINGLSPRLPINEAYLDFLASLGDYVSAALNNAMAYETEKKKAEDLAALDKAKTTFFSNVSHEFRTPLTLILGPLEEAISQGLMGKKNWVKMDREALESAHRNSLRLLKLVNSLLDFSRVEAGRIAASFEAVDLGPYTQELASQFVSVIQQSGLSFKLKIEQLSEPIFVDRSMWEKIVFNLISNAFKFTFEGFIAISVQDLPGAIELRIQDSGTGITEEELPKIFQRFHRVQGAKSRSFEGTGIGLALVQELVKIQSGTISVTSVFGQGTEFCVRLPKGKAHLLPEQLQNIQKSSLRDFQPDSARAQAYVTEAKMWLQGSSTSSYPSSDSPPLEPTQAQPLILVVDDNADMRAHIARLLSPHYQLTTAIHGKDALQKLKNFLPDLIISDAMMPEMDGFEFLKAVRANDITQRIPVIMLSARAGDEAAVEGLKSGADDYLVKPFSPKELFARVNTQISMANLRRDLHAERKAKVAQDEIRKLSLLLDATPDHVFLLNERGQYVYHNKATADALSEQLKAVGMEGLPSLGKSAHELKFEPEFLARFEAHQKQAFKGKTVIGQVLFPTITGPREFEYILSPHFNSLGKIDTILGITRDVHDLKNAIRIRDQFLSIASHELKTPLTSLSLRVQGRNREIKTKGIESFVLTRLFKMFEDDEKQIKRLNRLVDDMLDITRLRHKTWLISPEKLDLSQLVLEVTERMRAEFQGLTTPLMFHSPGPIFGIWDRFRLEQVVGNLLTNALKYGSKKPVSVKLTLEEENVCIEVKDKGIGIAPANQERVFRQFERAVSENEVSGLGLGLFISEQIVSAHRGRIELKSQLGEGSTFQVYLPKNTS